MPGKINNEEEEQQFEVTMSAMECDIHMRKLCVKLTNTANFILMLIKGR
jgi:hypothetical protein